MRVVAGRKGEALRLTRRNVEDDLCVLPNLVLAAIHVEWTAADVAQQHVSVTDEQIALGKAEGEAAVTAVLRPSGAR
jgi:hypothetical protein